MAYYVTIWQYDIYPSLRAAFEQRFGPTSDAPPESLQIAAELPVAAAT